MDFLKVIKEFYIYIIGEGEDGYTGDNGYEAKYMIAKITELLLEGLQFRARGLELLTKEQFSVLRDLLNGLNSMTDDQMMKIHDELPRLFMILTFLEKIDYTGYTSLMYLLNP